MPTKQQSITYQAPSAGGLCLAVVLPLLIGEPNDHPYGSHRRSRPPRLGTYGHQRPHWRLFVLQRSVVEELSCQVLPAAVAVMGIDLESSPTEWRAGRRAGRPKWQRW